MKPSMFNLAPIFAVTLLLEGCTPRPAEFKGYDGPPLAVEQLSVIRVPQSRATCIRKLDRIDGETHKSVFSKVEFDRGCIRCSSIKLTPGDYYISGTFHVFRKQSSQLSATVTLEAGHKYTFKGDSCSPLVDLRVGCGVDIGVKTMFGRPMKRTNNTTVYLRDDTAGKVVAGKQW